MLIIQTPTELSAGVLLLCISQKVSYKLRKDLHIYCSYCPKELETVFIEFIIPNKPNFNVGAVCKHPSIQRCRLNNNFLENLLNKIQTEKKFSLLSGDLNLNSVDYILVYILVKCTDACDHNLN